MIPQSPRKDFLNDKEEGQWIKYHENGQIREIINYKSGILNGIRLLIDKKGKIKGTRVLF